MTAGPPVPGAGLIRGEDPAARRGRIAPTRIGPAVRFPAPTIPIAKVQP